ncbi:MAG: hypothetical protein R3C68_00120 [Myxococcota bacterium]
MLVLKGAAPGMLYVDGRKIGKVRQQKVLTLGLGSIHLKFVASVV